MLRRSLKRVPHGCEGEGAMKAPTKRNTKKSKVLGCWDVEKMDAENVLEKLVLGRDADVLERLTSSKQVQCKKRRPLQEEDGRGKEAAWVDEDDEVLRINSTSGKRLTTTHRGESKHISGAEYQERLKSQFERVSGTPSWARLKSEPEQSSDADSDVDELTQSTGNYLTSSESLPKSLIQVKKCTDVNRESVSKGKITCVEFHPSSPVVLTAALTQVLNLFQVDGKVNPKIQTVYLDNFPIYTAHFSTDGQEVIMGSKHKSFYFYDMIAGKIVNIPQIKGIEENSMKHFEVSPDGRFLAFLGKYGYIHLLSAKSKEWIHSLKMNGSVESIAFSKDGKNMYSHGDDGQVYVWDMDRRDCVHRFVDEGCVKGTAVGTSPSGQYLACGSQSGVVNIYETSSCLLSRSPKPLKAVMNLTTPCTSALFNSASEILALTSNYSEKAAKLVHLPSLTVFSNFPDRTDANLRIPISMDFSPHSGYFTIGTHKGNALLYRLKHYENY